MKKLYIIGALLVGMTFFNACKKEKVADIDCAAEVSYSEDIKPMIDQSCAIAGCHVSGFWKGDYTSFEDVKKHADKGSMFRKVVQNKTMPKGDGGDLTQAQIDLFHCWLDQGALEN